jgi:hypothetical protein
MKITTFNNLDEITGNEGKILLYDEAKSKIGASTETVNEIIQDQVGGDISRLEGRVSTVESDVETLNGAIALKADADKVYTKMQVDEKFADFGGFEVAEGTGEDSYPNVENPDVKKIYLVKKGTKKDKYCEWIWTKEEDSSENTWVLIGETTVELTDYAKTVDVDVALALKEDKVFIAEYGVTPYADIKAAYDAGRQIVCKKIYGQDPVYVALTVYSNSNFIFRYNGFISSDWWACLPTGWSDVTHSQLTAGADLVINNGEIGVNTNGTAQGTYAFVEGINTTANGDYSHAEGSGTSANGKYSHTEGLITSANGRDAHAEGYKTSAFAQDAHAEGLGTIAAGAASHSEGGDTHASGTGAHAEGQATTAKGSGAHAEGNGTSACRDSSHAEGNRTSANAFYSHTEGFATYTEGEAAHAEGFETSAIGSASHAAGSGTIASAACMTVIGKYNKTNSAAFVIGDGYVNPGNSIVRSDSFIIDMKGNLLGKDCTIYDTFSTIGGGIAFGSACSADSCHVALGVSSKAIGPKPGDSTYKCPSVAIGSGCYSNYGGFSYGSNSTASVGNITAYAIAMGNSAYAEQSVALGKNVSATNHSFAFGDYNTNTSADYYSIAFAGSTAKNQSIAISHYTSADHNSIAIGNFGNNGSYAKANYYSIAIGGAVAINSAVAIGYRLSAGDNVVAFGQFNQTTANASLVIGNGTANNARSDAFIVDWDGKASATKLATSGLQDVEQAIKDVAAINTYEVVNGTTTGDITNPTTKTIYLIKDTSVTGSDKYNEWICTNTATPTFVKIGDTSIDLTPYLTKTSADVDYQPKGDYVQLSTYNTLTAKVQELETLLNTYSGLWVLTNQPSNNG